jgi:hypothetical protein
MESELSSTLAPDLAYVLTRVQIGHTFSYLLVVLFLERVSFQQHRKLLEVQLTFIQK